MGRFCDGLMAVFRVVQVILSIAALACGAFITYNMVSLSNAAQKIETSLDNLNKAGERQKIETSMGSAFTDLHITDNEVQGFLQDLAKFLSPIFHLFERTPARVILLTAVSLWSVCIIIYLLVAQGATNSPRMNKRSIRIILELLTLILWIAGIVCAALLASEYGAIIFIGGAELKLAWKTIKPIIKQALETLVRNGPILRELDIVNDIFNIAAVSILAVVAACICGAVSFVSLLAAFCISDKSKTKNAYLQTGGPEYMALVSADKAGFLLSETSLPASWNRSTQVC